MGWGVLFMSNNRLLTCHRFISRAKLNGWGWRFASFSAVFFFFFSVLASATLFFVAATCTAILAFFCSLCWFFAASASAALPCICRRWVYKFFLCLNGVLQMWHSCWAWAAATLAAIFSLLISRLKSARAAAPCAFEMCLLRCWGCLNSALQMWHFDWKKRVEVK